MAERYLWHLAQGLRPGHVVAVTFTEKAADELRSRIRSYAQGRLTPELLLELEGAPIGTLDSLALRVVQEHPEAAGVPYGVQVLDEYSYSLWLEGQLREALEALDLKVVALPYPLLVRALRELVRDPLVAERAFAVQQDDPQVERERLEKLLEEFRQAALARLFKEARAWESRLREYRASDLPPKDPCQRPTGQALSLLAELSPSLGAEQAGKILNDLAMLRLPSQSETTLLEELRDWARHLADLVLVQKKPADLWLLEALPELRRAYGQVHQIPGGGQRARAPFGVCRSHLPSSEGFGASRGAGCLPAVSRVSDR